MSDINVTPLVDVTLVILIVFMITFPTIVGVAPIKIDLPESGSVAIGEPEALPLNLYLRRTENGDVALYHDTKLTDKDSLVKLLKEMNVKAENQPTSLSAEQNIVYGEVTKVMDMLASIGIHKISLNTKHVGR
jgi:biopolymer transport protein ExbD